MQLDEKVKDLRALLIVIGGWLNANPTRSLDEVGDGFLLLLEDEIESELVRRSEATIH